MINARSHNGASVRAVVTAVVVGLLLLTVAVTPADAAKKHKKGKGHRHQNAGTAGATVTGSVKNRAGHGVGGALVSLQHLAAHRNRVRGGGARVHTNHAGEFTLHAPIDRYAIVASKRGVGRVRAFITPSPGSATHVTLIISPHHHHHHHKQHHHHHHVASTGTRKTQ